jgi:hypothetical protein
MIKIKAALFTILVLTFSCGSKSKLANEIEQSNTSYEVNIMVGKKMKHIKIPFSFDVANPYIKNFEVIYKDNKKITLKYKEKSTQSIIFYSKSNEIIEASVEVKMNSGYENLDNDAYIDKFSSEKEKIKNDILFAFNSGGMKLYELLFFDMREVEQIKYWSMKYIYITPSNEYITETNYIYNENGVKYVLKLSCLTQNAGKWEGQFLTPIHSMKFNN